MPVKNGAESDGWARMRPAIFHPIKLRPQGMKKAFRSKLSYGAGAATLRPVAPGGNSSLLLLSA